MSKLTEQMDRIETKLSADNIKDRLRGLADNAVIEEIDDKLNQILDKLESDDDVVENQAGYIHFLENEIAIHCEEKRQLRKKNKRLKKKVKRLSAYIDEMETAE